MKLPIGNDLILGDLADGTGVLRLTQKERQKHVYVCGGTGVGKSSFLNYLIRQDIRNWRKSQSGLLLLDSHGSLYDDLMSWLARIDSNVPVIPIDLRQEDWIVSYNLLRQRQNADPAVLVDNIIDAMAHVWGAGGTNQTPLFARWAGNVLRALYENKLTLIEAEFLIDRLEKQIRHGMTVGLADKLSRQDWQFADTLTAKDYEAQISSTINRLLRFIRNKTIRAMFGQQNVSLDLGRALDEGSIILVSLSTEGGKVSQENAQLFATVLLNDLWSAARERGKKKGIKPFNLYLDEFQSYVTPTIAQNLDQARGFGLHLTMAHQFPKQLLNRGEHGRQVFDSIMENASSKVVFRLTDEENLSPMAKWLFMGVMNPDEIQHELYSTKILSYREETRRSVTRGSTLSKGGGSFTGTTGTHGASGRMEELEERDANAWNISNADSDGDSETWTEGESESETTGSVLIPVMGRELSQRQFRTLSDQLHRAMASLFDQRERHCVARIVGRNAPQSIVIPEISNIPVSSQRLKTYLNRLYENLPFALRGTEAQKAIADRASGFGKEFLNELASEPKLYRRKL